jgi:hypothetical protein
LESANDKFLKPIENWEESDQVTTWHRLTIKRCNR